MNRLGRRGGLRAGGLALALACATLVGCGDDDSPAPAPTATGGAAATRTATQAPTQQGQATATRTTGAAATFTPTPDGAQPTQTQGTNPAQAKVESFVANAFGDLLNLSSFLSFGGSSLSDGSGAVDIPGLPGGITIPPVPCPSGGTLQIGCGSGFQVTFAQCRVAGGGAQSLIDGTFTLGGGGSCPSFPGAGQPFTIGVDADISSSAGGQTRNVSINLSESILLTSEGTRLEVNGDANVDCVGPVQIQTMEPIFVPTNATCPTQGAMRVGIAGTNSVIHSTAGGGIDLDLDADGSMDVSYANCDDPAPSSCD